MDKIYDSSYSITLDINVKLENEPQLFDSTYSICMAIYNKLGGEETNFDSTYSIVEAILPLAGVEYVHPFDSTYSLCLAIYDKLGGEPAIFDSTYSILLGILPLVEPGPEPISYPGLKFKSTGNSTISMTKTNANAPTANLQYSLDGGENWTEFGFDGTNYDTISLGDKDVVCFKGTNTTFATKEQRPIRSSATERSREAPRVAVKNNTFKPCFLCVIIIP